MNKTIKTALCGLTISALVLVLSIFKLSIIPTAILLMALFGVFIYMLMSDKS